MKRLATAVILLFQSTPSIRRATALVAASEATQGISIHALHTEGDASFDCHVNEAIEISIHALHTEGDAFVSR